MLAKKWGQIRRDEANGRKIVTYCAGCAGFLDRATPTVHIADVLFSTDKAINGRLHKGIALTVVFGISVALFFIIRHNMGFNNHCIQKGDHHETRSQKSING